MLILFCVKVLIQWSDNFLLPMLMQICTHLFSDRGTRWCGQFSPRSDGFRVNPEKLTHFYVLPNDDFLKENSENKNENIVPINFHICSIYTGVVKYLPNLINISQQFAKIFLFGKFTNFPKTAFFQTPNTYIFCYI